MITGREVTWLAPDILVAITLHGHRYRGHIVERTGRHTWRVDLEAGYDDNGRYHLRGGGIYEVSTSGAPDRVEHLLCTAMPDEDAAQAYTTYLEDLASHPGEDPACVYARHYQ